MKAAPPSPPESAPGGITDRVSVRLRWAILISVAFNLLLWKSVSGIVTRSALSSPPPIEVTRVILDKKGRKTEKIVTRKAIQKKVAQKRKAIPRKVVKKSPPPRKAPIPRAMSTAKHTPPSPQKPRPAQASPPEGAHNHVLTATPKPNAPSSSQDFAALAGGNAEVGKPIEAQNPGNAAANPPEPVSPKPTPVEEPKPAPKPASPPAPVEPKPVETPKPAPPPPPKPVEKPAPPPPPAPKGPTRDAQPTDTVQPKIPDELRSQDYKSYVRVRVTIEADGSATPELRTSSGNAEIDRRVLDALKRWKWKPALSDGEPVKSVQLFKFEFEVN
jgi:TonB family protein